MSGIDVAGKRTNNNGEKIPRGVSIFLSEKIMLTAGDEAVLESIGEGDRRHIG